jgi:hypothetical protein
LCWTNFRRVDFHAGAQKLENLGGIGTAATDVILAHAHDQGATLLEGKQFAPTLPEIVNRNVTAAGVPLNEGIDARPDAAAEGPGHHGTILQGALP